MGKIFIKDGAKMRCPYGKKEVFISVPDRGVNEDGVGGYPAYKQDAIPDVNIPNFEKCTSPFNAAGTKSRPSSQCTLDLVNQWEETVPATEKQNLSDKRITAYNNFYSAYSKTMEEFLPTSRKIMSELHKARNLPNGSQAIRNDVLESYHISISNIAQKIEQHPSLSFQGLDLGKIREERLYNAVYHLWSNLLAKRKIALSLAQAARLPEKIYFIVTPSEISTVGEYIQRLKNSWTAYLSAYNTLATTVATERLTMESVLWCKRKGDITFLDSGPDSNDIYDIERREVGQYDETFPLFRWQGVTLYISETGYEMLAGYDKHTDKFFLYYEDDIIYLLDILSLIAMENGKAAQKNLRETQIQKYRYLSVEDILAAAGIDAKTLHNDGGRWHVFTQVPTNEAMLSGGIAALETKVNSFDFSKLIRGTVEWEVQPCLRVPTIFGLLELGVKVKTSLGTKGGPKFTIEQEMVTNFASNGTKSFESEVTKILGGEIFRGIFFEKEAGGKSGEDSSYKTTLKGQMGDLPYEVSYGGAGRGGEVKITTGQVNFSVEVTTHYVKFMVELELNPFNETLWVIDEHGEEIKIQGSVSATPYAILYVLRNHAMESLLFGNVMMNAIASTYYITLRAGVNFANAFVAPTTAEEMLQSLNQLYDDIIVTEAERVQGAKAAAVALLLVFVVLTLPITVPAVIAALPVVAPAIPAVGELVTVGATVFVAVIELTDPKIEKNHE